MRFPLGKGVIGQVALTRQPILLNDVSTSDNHFAVNPAVRSELAVPLIAKNRLIGVMDLESEQTGYFRTEHLDLLTLTASRIAQAIENARLYTRVSRQAETLSVLNEIAIELTSILDLDPLLERVGQLLRRLIDYQMFTVMLLDEKGETLITRYVWRFGHAQAPVLRLPITKGLAGAAVREWRLVNVPDVRKDPRYLPMNPETRSELIVPLFYKRDANGLPPPILLVHGDQDPVIPVEAMFLAMGELAEAKIPVEWHLAFGVGHGIDPEGLRHGGLFLARALGVRAR